MRDPCYAWQRADTFADIPGQDYDDLVLTGSGTQPPPDLDTSLRMRPVKVVHGQGKQSASSAVPAGLPYTSVERLRFRDGKYLPMQDTDTTIPEH